jgi:hypothetical protein
MIPEGNVHLVRFELTAFPFGGERSNPTELQVREMILYLWERSERLNRELCGGYRG